MTDAALLTAAAFMLATIGGSMLGAGSRVGGVVWLLGLACLAKAERLA